MAHVRPPHARRSEGLWDHRPSEVYARVTVPVLLVPADTGELARASDKREGVAQAMAGLPHVRERWFVRPTTTSTPSIPGELADVMLDQVAEGSSHEQPPRPRRDGVRRDGTHDGQGPPRAVRPVRGADVPAAIVDTPYGFQENADELSAPHAGVLPTSVGNPVEVASFRSTAEDAVTAATAVARLREARYVMAGPGSPSYALRQWAGQASPMPSGRSSPAAGPDDGAARPP